jgi:hypothetical protein
VRGQYERRLKLLRVCVPWGANGLQRLPCSTSSSMASWALPATSTTLRPGQQLSARVLDTRRGIPISLGVLWLELAQASA